MKEAIFRTGDGRELTCNEGSAAFELMSNDGSFKRIDQPDESEKVLDTESTDDVGEKDPPPVDLKKLNKTQLIEEAAKAGVDVTEEMTKAQIVAAIEAAEEK